MTSKTNLPTLWRFVWVSPPAGQDTLDQAMHAIAVGEAEEIYRVFGASPMGRILHERSEPTNAALQSTKNAINTLADCERSLVSGMQVWAPYLGGQQDENLREKLDDFMQVSKKLAHAIKCEGMHGACKTSAAKAFCQLAERLSSACLKKLASFLEIPTKSVNLNSTVMSGVTCITCCMLVNAPV